MQELLRGLDRAELDVLTARTREHTLAAGEGHRETRRFRPRLHRRYRPGYHPLYHCENAHALADGAPVCCTRTRSSYR